MEAVERWWLFVLCGLLYICWTAVELGQIRVEVGRERWDHEGTTCGEEGEGGRGGTRKRRRDAANGTRSSASSATAASAAAASGDGEQDMGRRMTTTTRRKRGGKRGPGLWRVHIVVIGLLHLAVSVWAVLFSSLSLRSGGCSSFAWDDDGSQEGIANHMWVCPMRASGDVYFAVGAAAAYSLIGWILMFADRSVKTRQTWTLLICVACAALCTGVGVMVLLDENDDVHINSQRFLLLLPLFVAPPRLWEALSFSMQAWCLRSSSAAALWIATGPPAAVVVSPPIAGEGRSHGIHSVPGGDVSGHDSDSDTADHDVDQLSLSENGEQEAPLLEHPHLTSPTTASSAHASTRPQPPLREGSIIRRTCFSLWELVSFRFFSRTLDMGAIQSLNEEDMPDLDPEDDTDIWANRFDQLFHHEMQRPPRKRSLLRIFRKLVGGQIVLLGAMKLLTALLSFTGPLVLHAIVRFVEDGETTPQGLYLVLILLVGSLISAVLNTQYNYLVSKCQVRLRAGLVPALYRKLLRLNLSAQAEAYTDTQQRNQQAQQARADGNEGDGNTGDEDGGTDGHSDAGGLSFSSGKLTNLMSVDTQSLTGNINSVQELWVVPLQVAVTLYLLYEEISFAFVAGIVVIFLVAPLNAAITKRIGIATKALMRHKDARVQVLDEVIHGIRAVKFLAWEQYFIRTCLRHRILELKQLGLRKYLDALCVFLWASTPVLVSFVTFGACVLIGQSPTAAQVYTAQALLNMLIWPLNAYPWVVNSVVEAHVAYQRISQFLFWEPSSSSSSQASEALPAPATHSPPPPPSSCDSDDDDNANEAPVVVLTDLYAAWPTGGLHSTETQLQQQSQQQSCQQPKRVGSSRLGRHNGNRVAGQQVYTSQPGARLSATALGRPASPEESATAPLLVAPPDNPHLSEKHEPAPGGAGTVGGTAALVSPSGTVGQFPRHSPALYATPTSQFRDNLFRDPHGPRDDEDDDNTTATDSSHSQAGSMDEVRLSASFADRDGGISGSQRGLSSLAEPSGVGSEYHASAHSRRALYGDSGSQAPGRTRSGSVGKSSAAAAAASIGRATAEATRRAHHAVSAHLHGCTTQTQHALANRDEESAPAVPQTSWCLRGVNLEVRAGELVAICGEVGAGKSSLLLAILGELRAVRGQVRTAAAGDSTPTTCNNNGGENREREDGVELHGGPIAYCPQLPSVLNMTVRDNILFGSPISVPAYDAVVAAAALEADLESMACGDETEVGERGSTLSGGQKLRIGTARAAYAPVGLVLLDDPYAALDRKTAIRIHKQLVRRLLQREQGRTVIFTTNSGSAKILRTCDKILVLEQGRCVALGSFSQLFETSSTFRQLLDRDGEGARCDETGEKDGDGDTDDGDSDGSGNDDHTTGVRSGSGGAQAEEFKSSTGANGDAAAIREKPSVTGRNSIDSLSARSRSSLTGGDVRLTVFDRGMPEPIWERWGRANGSRADSVETAAIRKRAEHGAARGGANGNAHAVGAGGGDGGSLSSLVQEEGRESGVVKSTVLVQYFWAVGRTLTVVVLLSLILAQACTVGYTFWLGYWTQHMSSMSHERFFVTSSIIVAATVACTLLRAFSFARASVLSAKRLFNTLFFSVMSASLSVFERIPAGRFLNRFSQDTFSIDDQLPFTLNIVFAQSVTLLGTAIILCVSDPLMLPVLAVVGFVYYHLQQFFRHSSRALRRLESVTRSPLYALFTETMEAAVTIRAFRQMRAFQHRCRALLTTNQRAMMSSTVASQWLQIRLQLLGVIVSTSIAFFAVAQGVFPWHELRMSAVLAGVSLSYAISIVANLNGLMTSMAETEQEFISVERVCEYMDLPAEGFDENADKASDVSHTASTVYNGVGDSDIPSGHGSHDRTPSFAASSSGVRVRSAGSSAIFSTAQQQPRSVQAHSPHHAPGHDWSRSGRQRRRRALRVLRHWWYYCCCIWACDGSGSDDAGASGVSQANDEDAEDEIDDSIAEIAESVVGHRRGNGSHDSSVFGGSYRRASRLSGVGLDGSRLPLTLSASAAALPVRDDAGKGTGTGFSESEDDEEQILSFTGEESHPSNSLFSQLRGGPGGGGGGDDPGYGLLPDTSSGTPSVAGSSLSLNDAAVGGGPMATGATGPEPSPPSTPPFTPAQSPLSARKLMQHRNALAAGGGAMATGPWPQFGGIEFEHVSLRYREGAPRSLRDVSFSVRAGEKVAIMGRTGSGKSSLLRVLLRLNSFDGAIRIDAIDVRHVGVRDLRTAISVIPQEPLLFGGTLRFNLDPLGRTEESVLEHAVVQCGLLDALASPGAEYPTVQQILLTQIEERGSNLSVGQGQLICLARALCRRSRIVCVDEATANIDPITERLLRQVLRESFRSATVLFIAHRAGAVRDLCTRVIRMDAGAIVEDGPVDAVLEGLQQPTTQS